MIYYLPKIIGTVCPGSTGFIKLLSSTCIHCKWSF